ncbi:MAG: hypothetical protein GY821_07995 [Gammaproteobacteria bacterium]|nr:hypothetical protein [Gammaproteobacteria bacterium]
MVKSQPKKITLKSILLENNQWWNFYQKHKKQLRPAIVENIVKLLSCRQTVRDYQTYTCSNKDCGHRKM